MAEREVRYCTTDDGVQIAFCVEGQGPPLMVTQIFVESFTLDHLCPEYRRYLDALADGRTLIRWDCRGVGMSPYDGDDLTFGAFALEIKAVQEALGLDQVSLYGTTVHGSSAIEYTARYPGRVSRLILYGTYARVAAAIPEAVLRSFADLARANWPMACQLFADMTGRREFPETAARLADWYQESGNAASTAGAILAAITWDTTPQLAKIDVPTLVVHRVNDPTYGLDNGRAIAAGIKNARFVPVEGHAHLPSAGNPEPILQAIHAFLDRLARVQADAHVQRFRHRLRMSGERALQGDGAIHRRRH